MGGRLAAVGPWIALAARLLKPLGLVVTRLATGLPVGGDLEFADVRGAYGIGMRFNTYKAVFLRLDVAAGGSEGIRTFLKFSKAF